MGFKVSPTQSTLIPVLWFPLWLCVHWNHWGHQHLWDRWDHWDLWDHLGHWDNWDLWDHWEGSGCIIRSPCWALCGARGARAQQNKEQREVLCVAAAGTGP